MILVRNGSRCSVIVDPTVYDVLSLIEKLSYTPESYEGIIEGLKIKNTIRSGGSSRKVIFLNDNIQP